MTCIVLKSFTIIMDGMYRNTYCRILDQSHMSAVNSSVHQSHLYREVLYYYLLPCKNLNGDVSHEVTLILSNPSNLSKRES